jgi:hypothetical protein
MSLDLTGRAGEGHVFTTVPEQRGEVLKIQLKPCFTSLGLPRSAFNPDVQGIVGGKIFDAAAGGGTTVPGIVWIFMHEDYVRFNLRTGELLGPATIAGNWGNGRWPATFASGINAAVTFTNEPGFVWFFNGGQYIRYNLTNDAIDGPLPIVPNWAGWPESFASGVDAAIPGRGNFEGMAWFFKGSEYIRFNGNPDGEGLVQVDVGPTPIAAAWRGWPDRFTHVDCAISGVGGESQVIYFICGDEFIAYDLETDTTITSPKPVWSKWPQLAQFMRRPQLFLVETIELSTYFGDILAGSLQSTKPLVGGSDQTYTVILRRSATDTVVDTTTVLESHDQMLVDDVNSSMREDAASAHSTDQYDYKFDSSFEGDLDYTGLGGSVDATLNFQGSSNDVRDKTSKATMNAVQKQVSRTERNRRQRTQVVEGTHTVTSEFESTFTQTVRNPTDRQITVAFFQLVQEYVALTVVSDIKVGFSNGDRPDVVPLERLDLLLRRVIAGRAEAEFIKTALLTELRGMLDYKKRPVNILKDIDGTRVAFNPEAMSRFTLLNPDGTIRHNITVDGVIIGADTFNQLTQASLIKELNVG